MSKGEWKSHPEFPFVEVSAEVLKVAGKRTGLRHFARRGTVDDFRGWRVVLSEAFGGMIAVSHLLPYVGVSRQSLNQALKEERITCFFFQLSKREWRSGWGRDYGLYPLVEVEYWAKIRRGLI